jgi:hypothetical protein
MIDSKDKIIALFREEIDRKNLLISDLLEKQEVLEQRLAKMEAVLLFDENEMDGDKVEELFTTVSET